MGKFKPRVKGFVDWTADDRLRLAAVCQALGVTFEEFVHEATMQAVDEVEGPDGPFGISARVRRAGVEGAALERQSVRTVVTNCTCTDDPRAPGRVRLEHGHWANHQ